MLPFSAASRSTREHPRLRVPFRWTRRTLMLAVGAVVVLGFLLKPRVVELMDAWRRRPDVVPSSQELYPEHIFETNWARKFSPRHLVHSGILHRVCLRREDSIVPFRVGLTSDEDSEVLQKGDARVFDELRDCPDVDLFMPSGIRGNGYCEDGVAYTKYLQTRMLPLWVFRDNIHDPHNNKDVSYHDLCPRTPVIVFGHYWDEIRNDPSWPATKPIYLMPNIEMYELEAEHLWGVDAVLCKTRVCERYVSQWFKEFGNPRKAKVVFTRFTSADMSAKARDWFGTENLRAKDYQNVVFSHATGASVHKGTFAILKCWMARPDLPPMHVYIDPDFYNASFHQWYGEQLKTTPNIVIHTHGMPEMRFARMIAESSFFVCPSLMEGYGHIINQARASGGVLVTTDVPPMNELVTSSSGVLVKSKRLNDKSQLLGGASKRQHGLKDFQGLYAHFTPSALCDAIDEVVKMPPAHRQRLAERVRQQYFYDTYMFAETMQEIRSWTPAQPHHSRNPPRWDD